MNKQALIDAIRRSGGKRWALDEADDLWVRLDFLQKTGRYGQLLLGLANANDKSNFLALVLEANFAHQFESKTSPWSMRSSKTRRRLAPSTSFERYQAVQKGGVASFYGLGRFYVGRRAARNGRNPRTGATKLIPAVRVPRFHASKTGNAGGKFSPGVHLKAAMN